MEDYLDRMTQEGLHKKVACKPTLVRNGAQQTPGKCVMVQGGKDLIMFEKLRMARDSHFEGNQPLRRFKGKAGAIQAEVRSLDIASGMTEILAGE